MYKHILAATDFSDLGSKALLRAADMAVELSAKLTLLHVVGEEDATNAMYGAHEARQIVERLEQAHGEAKGQLGDRAAHIEVALEVRVGAAADQILALAADKRVDVIVIASNGQKGITRWLLGSTADRVVRGADCDVLVVS